MIYTKFKSEEFFIKPHVMKNSIPLDITPFEIILKIRKKEINQRKKEIDKIYTRS